MRTVLLIFFILIPWTLQAIAQPKDVEGWRKARWGMTEDEVQKAFEGQIEKLPQTEVIKSHYSNLVLRGVEIGGDKYVAQFYFGQSSKRLEEIDLVPEDKSRNSSFLYSNLEQMLIQKYGQPSFVDDKNSESGLIIKHHFWIFPTSTILLGYFEVPSRLDRPGVYIDYSPTKKEGNL